MVDPLRPYQHVVPDEGTFNRGDGVPGFQTGQFDVKGKPIPGTFNFIGRDPTIDELRELDAQNKLFDSSGRYTVPMTDTLREYMRERTGGRPIGTTIEAAKASPLAAFYSFLDTSFRTGLTELNKFQEFTLTGDQIESQVTAGFDPIMGGVPNIGGFFYDNMLSTEKPTNDTVEYYADKEGLFRTKEFELSPAQKELKYKMDIAYKENQLGRDLGFFEKQRLYQDEHSSVPEYMIDALVLSAEIIVPATATEKVIGLGLAKGVGKLVNNPATRKGVSYLPNWGEIVDNYTIKALEEVRIKNPKPKDMTDEDLWKTSVGYEVGAQTFDEQIDFVVRGGVDSKNPHLPSLEKQVGKPISEWSPTDYKKLEDDLRIAKEKATKFYDEIIDEVLKRDNISEVAILNAKTGTPFNALMFRGYGEKTPQQIADTSIVESGKIFGTDATLTYSHKNNVTRSHPELSVESIHINNPYVIETDDDFLNLFSTAGVPKNYIEWGMPEEIERFRQAILDLGYDGVIVKHPQNLEDGRRLFQYFRGDTVVSYKQSVVNTEKTASLLQMIPEKSSLEDGIRLSRLAQKFGTETSSEKENFVRLIRELIDEGMITQNSDGTVVKSARGKVLGESVDVGPRSEIDAAFVKGAERLGVDIKVNTKSRFNRGSKETATPKGTVDYLESPTRLIVDGKLDKTIEEAEQRILKIINNRPGSLSSVEQENVARISTQLSNRLGGDDVTTDLLELKDEFAEGAYFHPKGLGPQQSRDGVDRELLESMIDVGDIDAMTPQELSEVLLEFAAEMRRLNNVRQNKISTAIQKLYENEENLIKAGMGDDVAEQIDGNPAGIDPAIAKEAADHPVNQVMPTKTTLIMDSPRQLPSGDDIKPPPQYSDMFDEMWGNAPRETMYALFQRRWVDVMEMINDQFYGFRTLQRRVERMKAKNAKSKQDIKTGQREVNELQNRLASPAIKASQPKTLALRKKLDIAEKKLNDAIEQVSNTKLAENDLDFVTKITTAPGAIAAGATRAQIVFNEIQAIGHIMPDDLNKLLLIARNRELHKLGMPLPGGRKIEEVEDSFYKLMARLNPQQKEELVAGAEVILKFYRDERDRLLHSGIISKELYDDLATNHPYYNPVKYIESAADASYRGPSYPGFRNTDNRVIELTEETLNDPYERPLNLIGQVAIKNEATIIRNDLAKTMIKLGESFGREGKTNIVKKINVNKSPGKHTLEYFEDGELFVYEVPAWMKREADFLVKGSGNHMVSRFFGKINGVSRAAFTSMSPVFIPVNAMADVATALYTQRLLPHRTVAALYRMAKQGKNNHVAIAHRLSGGYQQRFYGDQGKSLAEGAGISTAGGKSQEQIAKELEKKVAGKWVYEGRPIGKKSVLGIIRENQPLALLSRAGEAVEQAPRQAFFKREVDNLLGKGWESKFTPEEVAQMPAVRKIAADSVELTLNFARGGYVIKELNPFVLFLNATLEGMKLPYRAMRQSQKARTTIASMMAGQVPLTMYNMSFPEYFDIPQRDRWGSLIIMLPPKEQNLDGTWKPNYISLLPYRDLALILGGTTYFLEQFASDTPTDFKHFALATIGNSTPFGQIPAPPVVIESAQQAANKNFYFGTSIVPADVIDEKPVRQIMPYTNRTFEEIGEAIGQSPVRLESAFTSTLGSSGTAITSVTDYIINLIDPRKVSPELANLITEYESFTDSTARRKWVHTLSSQQRDNLFFELARPDDLLPLIGPVLKRLNPNRSGGMAERAEQEAEQATGISVEQTQSVYAETRMIANDHLDSQQDLDRRLLEGKINGREWAKGKSQIGISYQSAINQASKGFPKSAQSASLEDRQEFYNIIKSLSRGADNETEKAQAIISGWYAITLPDSPLTEIGEGVGRTFIPSPEEWQILRQAQKEYRESLDEEELEILDNQIESGYTPLEGAYYRDSKLINEYYDYSSTLLQPGSDLYPILESIGNEFGLTVDQMIQDHEAYKATKKQDAASAKRNHQIGFRINQSISAHLKEFRENNYDLDKALYKWSIIDIPSNDQLMDEYIKLSEQFNHNITNRLYIDPQLMKELIPGLGSAIGGVVNGYN